MLFVELFRPINSTHILELECNSKRSSSFALITFPYPIIEGKSEIRKDAARF